MASVGNVGCSGGLCQLVCNCWLRRCFRCWCFVVAAGVGLPLSLWVLRPVLCCWVCGCAVGAVGRSSVFVCFLSFRPSRLWPVAPRALGSRRLRRCSRVVLRLVLLVAFRLVLVPLSDVWFTRGGAGGRWGGRGWSKVDDCYPYSHSSPPFSEPPIGWPRKSTLCLVPWSPWYPRDATLAIVFLRRASCAPRCKLPCFALVVP